MNLFDLLLSVSFAQGLTPWYMKAIDTQGLADIQVKNTVVAVIDTGIDLKHPALKNSLWVNPGETGLDKNGNPKATNGLDDDKNGFIDDVHGWNFANNTSDIRDTHGHGTHIAGLIAAQASPKNHFRGIAPGTQVMVLKYYDPQAPIGGNLMNSVRAIQYALSMGAHIINYSGGGLQPHPAERLALRKAEKRGVLVVAAAGNESTNTDALGFYPASYNLSNILSVMAEGPDQKRIPASNWGPNSIQISAPGEQILSTYLNGQMAYMTGTSQATAIATGVAVLLRETRKGQASPQELIQLISQSGKFNDRLVGKLINPLKVSLRRALKMEGGFFVEMEESLSTFQP